MKRKDMKCDRPTKTMVGFQGFLECDGEVKVYTLLRDGEPLATMKLCKTCLSAVKRACAILNVYPLGESPRKFSVRGEE